MKMRPDQERVRNLLTDTVTLLCKNGLQFTKQLKVQGLLGITTDDNDVFVVHIDEKFGDLIDSTAESTEKNQVEKSEKVGRKRPSEDSVRSSSSPTKIASPAGQPFPARHRNPTHPGGPSMRIKTEAKESDVELMSCQQSRVSDRESRDDRNAMQQSYSDISISDFHAGSHSGMDRVKRRSMPTASSSGQLSLSADSHDSGSDTNQSDAFGTGMMRDPGQPGSADSAISGLEQLSAEGIPWDPSQVPGGGPLGPGDPSMTSSLGFYPFAGRRPVLSDDKTQVCDHPGCGKTFYYRQTLLRHQTLKHGRQKTGKKIYGAPVSSFAAGGGNQPYQPGVASGGTEDEGLASVEENWDSASDGESDDGSSARHKT